MGKKRVDRGKKNKALAGRLAGWLAGAGAV